jgi:uncharacterized membrane-anchored protein
MRRDMPESFNRVPEVTLAIKIAATTLGETGGDTVTGRPWELRLVTG